jgi:hypothetical protein
MVSAESSNQAAPITPERKSTVVACPGSSETIAMPANAASKPSFCVPDTGCSRRRAAKATTKTGMVAEMMVPTEADVPETPKVWATWPTPIPSTPSAATRGNARHGSRSLPAQQSSKNGTAMPNRSPVSVNGGRLRRPSFVAGIDNPHMTARSNIAAQLPIEGTASRPTSRGREGPDGKSATSPGGRALRASGERSDIMMGRSAVFGRP